MKPSSRRFRALSFALVAAASSASCQPQSAPQAPSPAVSAEPTSPVAAPAPALAPEAPVPWWDEAYPKRFDVSTLSKRLDVLRVEGNRFVDSKGVTQILQGVNISDPDKLERGGHFTRRYFEEIRAWGANVVRVPVHPVAWRERGKAAYFELLDRAVVWATELDLYLIIDWHSIGNLMTGLFQHPMYDTDQQETLEFWRSVSFRYAEVPRWRFTSCSTNPPCAAARWALPRGGPGRRSTRR